MNAPVVFCFHPRRWQLGGQPALDWPTFLGKKNAELQRLNGIYMNLLKNSGVEVRLCLAGFACGRSHPQQSLQRKRCRSGWLFVLKCPPRLQPVLPHALLQQAHVQCRSCPCTCHRLVAGPS